LFFDLLDKGCLRLDPPSGESKHKHQKRPELSFQLTFVSLHKLDRDALLQAAWRAGCLSDIILHSLAC